MDRRSTEARNAKVHGKSGRPSKSPELDGRTCSRLSALFASLRRPSRLLYLLGEERRIVGISGYVVRPLRARREKPRVSAFISADIPKILDLKPDLVLTFSDLQADIATALIRAGVDVHAFNQRTIPQILDMIRTLGALVGASDRADRLAEELAATVAGARTAPLPRRPKVYFEEWDDPMISGRLGACGESGRWR